MSASRVFFGGFHAVSLDGLNPKANRKIRIGFGLFDRFLDKEVYGLQIVSVGNGDHIPTERAKGGKRTLHAERIFGDAPRKFGVVIGEHEDEWIHLVFSRQPG